MRHERRFAKEVSSLGALFDFLAGSLEAEGLDGSIEFWLELAVEEAFTNMVRHGEGSSNPILVGVERVEDRVVVELTDFDVEPFDPASVPQPDLGAPPRDRGRGGLGLHLLRSVVDRLSYEYRDRNLKVTLSKDLTP